MDPVYEKTEIIKCSVNNSSLNQDIILPTIVRTILGTIVSRVTRGDGRFVDLMIILY